MATPLILGNLCLAEVVVEMLLHLFLSAARSGFAMLSTMGFLALAFWWLWSCKQNVKCASFLWLFSAQTPFQPNKSLLAVSFTKILAQHGWQVQITQNNLDSFRLLKYLPLYVYFMIHDPQVCILAQKSSKGTSILPTALHSARP